MDSLALKSSLSLVITEIVVAAIVFVSAGTLDYWQAWVFLVVFIGASTMITLHLLKRDRALLARRLKGGPTAEHDPTQKVIMLLASIGFIGMLVVPGLDQRWGWSSVPTWAVLLGDVLTAVGFYLTFLVYRANTYAAATIAVASDQRVVSTGPYAIVRHPMYASALLYLVGMPLGLGSWWGLAVLVPFVAVLIWRLVAEERFLVRNLPGYQEYRDKVRWRLVPGVY